MRPISEMFSIYNILHSKPQSNLPIYTEEDRPFSKQELVAYHKMIEDKRAEIRRLEEKMERGWPRINILIFIGFACQLTVLIIDIIQWIKK